MTQALIWYKQRQLHAQRARAAVRRPATVAPQQDEMGTGVVVFDLETTELIEDDVAVEDMSVSVACAMWLPTAATAEAALAEAASKTFWHESVTRAPNGEAAAGVRELLDWLDGAAMVVAYNGRGFDMRVLSRYYRKQRGGRQATGTPR